MRVYIYELLMDRHVHESENYYWKYIQHKKEGNFEASKKYLKLAKSHNRKAIMYLNKMSK